MFYTALIFSHHYSDEANIEKFTSINNYVNLLNLLKKKSDRGFCKN